MPGKKKEGKQEHDYELMSKRIARRVSISDVMFLEHDNMISFIILNSALPPRAMRVMNSDEGD